MMTALDATAKHALMQKADEWTKWILCCYDCENRPLAAVSEFALRHPHSPFLETIRLKTATDFGSTSATGWAAPLATVHPISDAFVELSRSASLLGRLPGIRRTGFNIATPAPTAGAIAAFRWTPQGGPVFVGDMRLVSLTLPPLKTTGAILVTAELLKSSIPEAVGILRNELVRGTSYFIDSTMLDQTLTAVTDLSPASITAAAPSFGSAGTSSANAQTDLKKLFQVFFTANPGATQAALVMSPGNAAAAGAAVGGSSTIGATGGLLWGVPCYPTGGGEPCGDARCQCAPRGGSERRRCEHHAAREH